MDIFFTQNNLLTFFALTAGVVSLIELLEYLVTKNIPWLIRSVHMFWKRMRYRFRKNEEVQGRHLVLNFSGHPVLPGQLEAIKVLMLWPSMKVIDVPMGTIAEDRKFVANIVGHL
ncbi:MAG: hypothetical protein HGB36_10080 [Chlorobiaceae bacterium]|nr:hypothetical protein [Chlorobiaceae bacterium]